MEEKSIKINIPEGYEIDNENSTFAEIKFKPIKEKYPKNWEEAFVDKQFKGFRINYVSKIETHYASRCKNDCKNCFKTEAQAKSALAYAQLTQLMSLPCYNGNWGPDWDDLTLKYVIERHGNRLIKSFCESFYNPICFKTKDIMDAFFTNHRDLLKIYFQIKK